MPQNAMGIRLLGNGRKIRIGRRYDGRSVATGTNDVDQPCGVCSDATRKWMIFVRHQDDAVRRLRYHGSRTPNAARLAFSRYEGIL